MTPQDLIKYWFDGASDALDTAEKLYMAKKYHFCLFFCHLALEKLLKGIVYLKTGQHAQPMHDLVKLSRQAKLQLSSKQEEQLDEITTFNVSARYDTIKRDFYKKATKNFTRIWFSKTKEVYQWLKSI